MKRFGLARAGKIMARNVGTMPLKKGGATISVSWGYDVRVSVTLTPANWAKVQAGKEHGIRGEGYYYEGEFFRDYWVFNGKSEGSLFVGYGEDGGEGFIGSLSDATIEEHPAPRLKKKRGAK
jgi:hypothetical protein